MKKISIVLIMLLFFCSIYLIKIDTGFVHAEEEILSCRVITDSAKIFADTDLASEVLLTANHKDVFTLKSESPITNLEGINFYSLDIEEFENAFILTSQVLINYGTAVLVKIIPNGTILSGTTTLELFTNTSSVFTKINEIEISENFEIRMLEGYNEYQPYTKVQFIYENELVTTYISTSIITPYGLKQSVKILLIILAVCIALSIATIVIYYKHKRKKQK